MIKSRPQRKLRLTNNKLLLAAGSSGLLGPITIVLMLSTTAAPWFNWSTNSMSDISVSSEGFLFNVSMIIAGIISIILAIGISNWIGLNLITRFGLVITGIGFFSLILLGFITKAFGAVHYLLAVIYYFGVSLGILLFGISMFKKGLFLHGILSGVTSCAAMASVLFIPRPGSAVSEVIGTILFGFWAFYMSLNLFFEET